ncbi:MAG: hypothetical protein AAGF95_30160 [Chloroflexota bacterium]
MDVQIVIDALLQIITDIIAFLPNLVNGLIIILVGYLVSRIVRFILRISLQRLKMDALVERAGVMSLLRNFGVQTPLSVLLAQTVFLLMLLSFLITATQLMGLAAVAQVLEQVLALLPNALAAIIVFLFGGFVAQIVGGVITASASNVGLNYASRLGRLVQYLIMIVVAVLALGIIGLDVALLITSLTIFIAAFGLAIGLALGLGARPLVYHILAGYYLRQRFPVGRSVTLEQEQINGQVSGLHGVNTVVTSEEEEIIIPNGRLLEQVVRSPKSKNNDTAES